jgi:hypothetical protein
MKSLNTFKLLIITALLIVCGHINSSATEKKHLRDTVKTNIVVVKTSSAGHGWYLKDIGGGRTQFVEIGITDVKSLLDSLATKVNRGEVLNTPDYANTNQVTNAINMATWGDSLTAGAGGTSYPNQLSALSGYNVFNMGIGGETSTQIYTRFHADTAKWRLPTIIWAGRNNYTSPAQVKIDIAAMVADLAAVGNSNYIIIGITTDTTQITGSAGYNTITTLNSDLATLYGTKFINILPYLVSKYDTGISQDVTDHSNGVIAFKHSQ